MLSEAMTPELIDELVPALKGYADCAGTEGFAINAACLMLETIADKLRTGQLVHEQAPKDVVGWLYTRGEDDADILLDYRDSELRQAGYKEEALCRTKAEANRKFSLGDRVTKTKGSSWTGLVVGFYSTSLTPIGYAVESENEPGSVQIYPESALEACLKARENGDG